MIKHPFGPAAESTGERFPAGPQNTLPIPAPNPAPAGARNEAFRPSRRSAVASLAAAGAVALVPATVVSATVDRPDRDLIEMGHRYAELEALEKAVDKQYDACFEHYQNQKPQPSDMLRHRLTDHIGGLCLPIINTCARGLSADHWRNDLYSEEEIERLKYSPPPFDVEHISEQKARIEEIVREWERWHAECDALAEAIGVYAASEAVDEIVLERHSLAKKIAAASATTIRGLKVRASILADILNPFEENEDAATDELMYRALARDILTMTV